ncbi:MAG: YidC/Oxa1 family membrane protein insertase [Clostridiales bacterium]|jgi:YidC/Oxa1 family membrane protein insertase|nr:YidC/Oxa1 family membrane protein insertase [Clostridiales bacterium]
MDIITTPFSWLLMFLYKMVSNYGLAIILFALVVKVILLPFGMKSKKSMMRSAQFTPRIKELEKKYEGNKQKYNEEVAKLYREEKIKPLGGCLWTLIPFPILIALYSVIRQPFTKMMSLSADQWTTVKNILTEKLSLAVDAGRGAYDQIFYAQKLHENFEAISTELATNHQDILNKVSDINFSFLGLNLAEKPNATFFLHIDDWSPAVVWPALGLFLIPIVSAALSFLASKISQKGTGTAPESGGMKGMLLLMPIMSLWIGFIMPAGLGIYWIASSVFSTIQDMWLTKKYGKQLAAEKAVKDEKNRLLEEEREKKRLETERLRLENATNANPNTSKRKIQNLERKKDEQKAAEWQAIHGKAKKKPEKENTSQVGDRLYARGRNYKPDRFGVNTSTGETDSNDILDEAPENKEALLEPHDMEAKDSSLADEIKDSEITDR